MLKAWQVGVLGLLGAAMWALVTYNIGRHPEAALDGSRALIGYATAPVGGAISIWLCKVAGRLSADQLLPGVVWVGAVAMMIDAAAIRWRPGLYGASDQAMALIGGDLMWGYGVALAMAVAWVAWARRRRAPAPGTVD